MGSQNRIRPNGVFTLTDILYVYHEVKKKTPTGYDIFISAPSIPFLSINFVLTGGGFEYKIV